MFDTSVIETSSIVNSFELDLNQVGKCLPPTLKVSALIVFETVCSND